MFCSVTLDGHRVAVYWDKRHEGSDEAWNQDIVTGLLHSICFFPLMSYGANAPLAALPIEACEASDCEMAEEPLGRPRLKGLEEDKEDTYLMVVRRPPPHSCGSVTYLCVRVCAIGFICVLARVFVSICSFLLLHL
jgi:hypothetical protein